MKKTNPTYKRTEGEKEVDKEFVLDLYLKGFSFTAITDGLNDSREYNVSRTQVTKDIKQEIELWKNERLDDISASVQLEIQKINVLEMEYWKAWIKSQKNQKTITTSAKNNVNEQKKVVGRTEISKTERQEESSGDVRFLQGVERCIQKRCELSGLDRAKEIVISGKLEHTTFELFTEGYPLKIAK